MDRHEKECPHYKPPRLYADPKTGQDYEGSAMCELVSKYCLVEYGQECEVYKDFLKEIEEASNDWW